MKIQNISNKNNIIYLFERLEDGTQKITEDKLFAPYYYELDERGKYLGYDGTLLRKVSVSHPSAIYAIRSLNSFESDVLYPKRYILDCIPTFETSPIKYLFIDIEILATELPDITLAKYPISCVSVYNSESKELKTWFLGEYGLDNEDGMLERVVDYIHHEAPDMLLAWNMEFDYTYLFHRISQFSKKISPIGMIRAFSKKEETYPAGISIVDYKGLYEKLTLNKKRSYALDYIAQEDLGETPFGNTEFGTLNTIIKEKNINDIRRMIKLEEKYRVIPHFDEIRRISRCLWEDLPQETLRKEGKFQKISNNSKIIDMLVLAEAKELEIILPKKKDYSCGGNEFKATMLDVYSTEFEGAYRETLKTGPFYKVGKYDLSSAYPQMISDFCLDPSNLTDNEGLKIDIKSRVEEEVTNTYYFKQNENTVLPRVIKKLLVLKNELKIRSKTSEEEKLKYSAIKSVVNSAYGVMGNKFFRLFSRPCAETITFLVRDLLRFVRDEATKTGYEILYIDTDSIFCQDGGKDISEELNTFIQKWAAQYNKKSNVCFEYEGSFDKILLLSKCHYYGYLNNGISVKKEIKGIEVKRNSSSKYEARFQEELINLILNHETKDQIVEWIKSEIERIKTLDFTEIGFPAKVNSEKYKNVPISVRACENTDKLFNVKIPRSELFYYIFIEPLGKDNKDKPLDVIAVSGACQIETKKHLFTVDWEEIIRRSIIQKTKTLFEVMNWGNLDRCLSNQVVLF